MAACSAANFIIFIFKQSSTTQSFLLSFAGLVNKKEYLNGGGRVREGLKKRFNINWALILFDVSLQG